MDQHAIAPFTAFRVKVESYYHGTQDDAVAFAVAATADEAKQLVAHGLMPGADPKDRIDDAEGNEHYIDEAESLGPCSLAPGLYPEPEILRAQVFRPQDMLDIVRLYPTESARPLSPSVVERIIRLIADND